MKLLFLVPLLVIILKILLLSLFVVIMLMIPNDNSHHITKCFVAWPKKLIMW